VFCPLPYLGGSKGGNVRIVPKADIEVVDLIRCGSAPTIKGFVAP
jgi:hypothetical protein